MMLRGTKLYERDPRFRNWTIYLSHKWLLPNRLLLLPNQHLHPTDRQGEKAWRRSDVEVKSLFHAAKDLFLFGLSLGLSLIFSSIISFSFFLHHFFRVSKLPQPRCPLWASFYVVDAWQWIIRRYNTQEMARIEEQSYLIFVNTVFSRRKVTLFSVVWLILQLTFWSGLYIKNILHVIHDSSRTSSTLATTEHCHRTNYRSKP